MHSTYLRFLHIGNISSFFFASNLLMMCLKCSVSYFNKNSIICVKLLINNLTCLVGSFQQAQVEHLASCSGFNYLVIVSLTQSITANKKITSETCSRCIYSSQMMKETTLTTLTTEILSRFCLLTITSNKHL